MAKRQLKSLVETYKEKAAEAAQENQQREQRSPGRPQSDEKKARLNFVVSEDLAEDLKALASIKKKSLTSLFCDAVAYEIAQNRKEIDLIRRMQQ